MSEGILAPALLIPAARPPRASAADPEADAAREAWRVLAPALAGAPRMRVSRDGGLNYPQRHETALTAANPGQPATIPVFCRAAGTGRLLALDFDVTRARGAADPAAVVAAQVGELTRLVTRLGGTPITDISPSGGRHVLVLFAAALPWRELRDLAQAIALRFSTLDWASTTSRDSAQIRPPGARHKTGGWQTLTMPLADAIAAACMPCGPGVWTRLLDEFAAELAIAAPVAMPDAVPPGAEQADDGTPWLPRLGGPAALSPAVQAIAQAGIWPAEKYATGSDARMAVITAAAAAGWQLADVQARLADGSWRGLARLYTHPRERRRLERLLPREWDRAIAYLGACGLQLSRAGGSQKSPPPRPGEENPRNWHTSPALSRPPGKGSGKKENHDDLATVRAWIRLWVTAVDMAAADPDRVQAWGRQSVSARLLLAALAQAAMVSGSMVIEFGVRNLALHAGISHRTAARMLAMLREENDPLIDVVSAHRMKRADRYQLRIPLAYAEACRWRRRRAGWIEAIHPAFTVLGGTAALTYAALGCDNIPAAEIARAARLSESAVAAALIALAEHGLAVHGKHGWARGPVTLAMAAAATGAADLHQERADRYKSDRKAWHAIVDSWLASSPGHVQDHSWVPSFDDIPPEDLEPPRWLVDDPGPPAATITLALGCPGRTVPVGVAPGSRGQLQAYSGIFRPPSKPGSIRMLRRLKLAAGSARIDDVIRYELRLGVSLTRFETLLHHADLPDGCYRLVIAQIMNLLGVRELSTGEARRLITARIGQATGYRSIEAYNAARQAGTPGTIDTSRWSVMNLDTDMCSLASMLYVIGPACGGIVKIGRSADIRQRLQALQGASPQPLAVLYAAPGASGAETSVHAHFASRHIRGEWFDLTGTEAGPAVRDGLLAVEGLGSLAELDQARAEAAADPAGHDAQARAMVRAGLQAEAGRRDHPPAQPALDSQGKADLLARLSEPDPRTAAIARIRSRRDVPITRASQPR